MEMAVATTIAAEGGHQKQANNSIDAAQSTASYPVNGQVLLVSSSSFCLFS
jgi:hypothetical protein